MAPESPPLVTLVSTYTADHLPLPDGTVRTQQGGPAHYMGKALSELSVQFRLVTGDVAPVEVIPGPEGERYIIPEIAPIPIGSLPESNAVVLSPVMREIPPESVPHVRGLLALDLQGFVRRPRHPSGGLDTAVDLTSLLCRTDIIKASEPELAALTPESQDAMRHAMVLVTHGDRGAIVKYGDDVITITAQPVPAPNTIGAGDTFLSAFLVGVLRGSGPREAGEQAARFTESVLRRRLPH